MRERKGYKLPSQSGGEDVFLPDFVTIGWESNNELVEVEVHPDRVEDFKKRQEELEGQIEWIDERGISR